MSKKRLREFLQVIVSLVTLGAIAFGSAGQASAASIIYVKYNASGSNNGTSWANAYKDLQSALAAAGTGQQIWVAKGTYYPTPTTDWTFSFDLKNGVEVYGGFAGAETLLSQRNFTTNVTILSGDIGLPGDSTDNSYHVVDSSGTDGSAVLDGFTITGGHAFGSYPTYYGGGIRNDNGSPTLRNLIIRLNSAFAGGGGMYSQSGSPTLTNVTFDQNSTMNSGGGLQNAGGNPVLANVVFSNNTAVDGGGMDTSGLGSSPSLTDVTFTHNQASSKGGGLSDYFGSNAVLNNVTFDQNQAGFGGGIQDRESNPTLKNVTFSGNSANNGVGGGMYNDSSSPTLVNTSFTGNGAHCDSGCGPAAAAGGGMGNANGSNPIINNSIFWGDETPEIYDASGSPTLNGDIVQDGCPSSSTCNGVLIGDPVFDPLQNNGGFTQTLALGLASAAIDAGGQEAPCVSTDQRGVPRPQGLACDYGAYEVRAMPFASQKANDGCVLQSTAAADTGGSFCGNGIIFPVGDNASNQSYRGFLSFNTALLPSGKTLVKAALQLLKHKIVGDPFGTEGALTSDLARPYFGSSASLQLSDYNAPATVSDTAKFWSPNGLLYWAILDNAGLSNINLTGTTQFRLRFDGVPVYVVNNTEDSISFYFIDILTVTHHFPPTLFVYYNP